MEALKAEIAAKRKALDDVSSSRPQKYMRRGDLERMKEEQERQAREDKEKSEREAEESRRAAEKANSKPKVGVFFSVDPPCIVERMYSSGCPTTYLEFAYAQ